MSLKLRTWTKSSTKKIRKTACFIAKNECTKVRFHIENPSWMTSRNNAYPRLVGARRKKIIQYYRYIIMDTEDKTRLNATSPSFERKYAKSPTLRKIIVGAAQKKASYIMDNDEDKIPLNATTTSSSPSSASSSLPPPPPPPPVPSSSQKNNNRNKKRWGFLNAFAPVPQSVKLQRRVLKETILKGNDDDICSYISQNPNCCQEKHNFFDRHYPLYIVCGRTRFQRLSLQTVQLVYEASPPDAIEGTLHYAIGRKASLDIIKFLISKHPDGAQTQYKGWLPLHKACATALCPIDTIEYLIDCYPAGVKRRACNNLSLPLHLAIEYMAPLEVIQLLISKYPNALKMADYNTSAVKTVRGWLCYQSANGTIDGFWGGGGLPLHIACRDRANSMRLLKYLILQYPNALKSKNRSGWLPLHFACFRGSPLNIIQMIVNCCPDAVIEATVDRRWPIDMCVSRFNPNFLVIQYIISRHPTTTGKAPDKSLFYKYYDESTAVFTSIRVCNFLKTVAQRAGEGYTFVYPREL